MGQPIAHFEIMGKDAVGLQKFYRELFDWNIAEPVAEMGMYGLVDRASAGIGGGIGEEQNGGSRVTIYVVVPDLQRTLDQAVAAGGQVAMPPTDIPNGPTFAMFTDPAGNVMGILKDMAAGQ